MLKEKKLESSMPESEIEENIQPLSSNTVLAEDAVFKGDFESKEPMTIHGELQGNIQSTSDVTLSQQAKLTGNLNAENIRIAGSVKGDINCKSIMEIAENGKVEGDLKASRFIMSEEGVFEGNLKVGKQANKDKPSKAA